VPPPTNAPTEPKSSAAAAPETAADIGFFNAAQRPPAARPRAARHGHCHTHRRVLNSPSRAAPVSAPPGARMRSTSARRYHRHARFRRFTAVSTALMDPALAAILGQH
jgi:hypothetical protein